MSVSDSPDVSIRAVEAGCRGAADTVLAAHDPRVATDDTSRRRRRADGIDERFGYSTTVARTVPCCLPVTNPASPRRSLNESDSRFAPSGH